MAAAYGFSPVEGILLFLYQLSVQFIYILADLRFNMRAIQVSVKFRKIVMETD
jgi:hypothetical protein